MPRSLLFHLPLFLLLALAGSPVSRADAPSATAQESPDHLDALLRLFDFKPIAEEGGYFVSTYHSAEMVPGVTPDAPQRMAGTAIYFLMKPGDFSALHRLKEDEIYHYYTGSPIEMLLLSPDGTGKVTICGPEFWKGQQPQVLVRRGLWQGSHPLDPNTYALLGTTMTPGYTGSSFELGKRDELIRAYPQFAARIKALTRLPSP